MAVFAGKSSKSSKAKNSKKQADADSGAKRKSSFHIPKNNPILSWDSDDDCIGQEPSHHNNSAAKFLSNSNPMVSSMLKPKSLFAPEFHSLRHDFSNLV